MTEAGYALESPRLSALARPRSGRRLATVTAVSAQVAQKRVATVLNRLKPKDGGTMDPELTAAISRVGL